MKTVTWLILTSWLMIWSVASVGAQEVKDTLKLGTVRIDGKNTSSQFKHFGRDIDSVTLAKSSTVRLSELLSQNTTIFIKEYGRGAMATASFRGTAPSHTKVSWNGLEINSPMLGMVDFSLIPVYFTDEVILFHGSSSLLESGGALGGTIRLENSPNWENKLSGKVLSGLGSYKTVDSYLQVSAGNRKIQSKSAIFYNSSANDFTFYNKLNATIDPVTGDYLYKKEKNRNAGYLNYGLLQEFYLQPNGRNNFGLKIWLQHNERSIPQLLTNESEDAANLNRQSEEALRSVAEWRHSGIRSRWTAVSAINLQNSAYKLENKVNGAQSLVAMDAKATLLSLTNKLTCTYLFNGWLTGTTGLESTLHHVVSDNRSPNGQTTGYNQSRNEFSLFGELEGTLSPRWKAALLAREVFIDYRHQALLPLSSLTYRPNSEKSLVFKGSVAFNSHPPTLNDLYYIPGGNPGLQSEKGLQTDFGTEGDIALGKQTFHSGISVFHSDINNWIIWLPSFQGYWEPANLQKVVSDGIEAKVAWKAVLRGIRVNLNGNYAFTSTQNRDPESPSFRKQLPYVPKHSANLNLSLAYNRLYFDWLWNYYSKRYTTSANSVETISDYLYPYFMSNVQAGYTFRIRADKLTVACKVLNVFDEDYRTVLQRPMPGRNYQISLRYDF